MKIQTGVTYDLIRPLAGKTFPEVSTCIGTFTYYRAFLPGERVLVKGIYKNRVYFSKNEAALYWADEGQFRDAIIQLDPSPRIDYSMLPITCRSPEKIDRLVRKINEWIRSNDHGSPPAGYCKDVSGQFLILLPPGLSIDAVFSALRRLNMQINIKTEDTE